MIKALNSVVEDVACEGNLEALHADSGISHWELSDVSCSQCTMFILLQ